MRTFSPYLHDVFSYPQEYAALANKVAANVLTLKKRLKFDAIAFTGASGSAMAYPVSMLTGIPLLLVRKRDEQTHGSRVEGPNGANIKKYAIIDDFICSGSTVKRIIEALSAEDQTMRCVCIMVYLSKYTHKLSELSLQFEGKPSIKFYTVDKSAQLVT